LESSGKNNRSALKRFFPALLLTLVGMLIGAGILFPVSAMIGPPLVAFNNAHSPGQISKGDATIYGIMRVSPVLAAAGLGLFIGLRRRGLYRYLCLGAAIFNALLFTALELVFYSLNQISW